MHKEFGIENKSHLGGYIINGDDSTFAKEVWDWMIRYGIKSVMDIGCGEGYSTKYFFDNGLDVIGIEGGEKAIANSPIKNKLVCHDFTSGAYIPSKIYDAIWCCEFVEHVEERYASNFLETFKYAKYILMTHAVPGQGGYHHVNEQKKEYWIEKIEKENFIFDEKLSIYIRNLTSAKWIQTLLFFKNKNI
jgi:SAM-dependent methyltransferase